jgi:hypothetical protein
MFLVMPADIKMKEEPRDRLAIPLGGPLFQEPIGEKTY